MMKIFVHAKPKSKKEFVERVDDTHLIVAVKDPPRIYLHNISSCVARKFPAAQGLPRKL